MFRSCLLITAFVLAPTVPATAAVSAAAPRLDAEKIKAGLRTATPEEDGFVDLVLEKVEQGELSAGLVASTFQWARHQPRRQFQYFKHGLAVRSAGRASSIQPATRSRNPLVRLLQLFLGNRP